MTTPILAIGADGIYIRRGDKKLNKGGFSSKASVPLHHAEPHHLHQTTKVSLDEEDENASPWINAQTMKFMDAADAAETKLNEMLDEENPAQAIQAEKKQVVDNLHDLINSPITTIEESLNNEVEPSKLKSSFSNPSSPPLRTWNPS